MKQEISPVMMGIAITLVVCVLGGAIWFFMSKADKSGPNRTNEVTPGTAKRAFPSGGGEAAPKESGASSQ